jgi:hypothetical protein
MSRALFDQIISEGKAEHPPFFSAAEVSEYVGDVHSLHVKWRIALYCHR